MIYGIGFVVPALTEILAVTKILALTKIGYNKSAILQILFIGSTSSAISSRNSTIQCLILGIFVQPPSHAFASSRFPFLCQAGSLLVIIIVMGLPSKRQGVNRHTTTEPSTKKNEKQSPQEAATSIATASVSSTTEQADATNSDITGSTATAATSPALTNVEPSERNGDIVPHQEAAATSISARVASVTTEQDAINSGITGSTTAAVTSPASTTMMSLTESPPRR
jgi:hypothetical protein